MKKSPFALLKEAIETELTDLSLLLQLANLEEMRVDNAYFIGYAEALKKMSEIANNIYFKEWKR